MIGVLVNRATDNYYDSGKYTIVEARKNRNIIMILIIYTRWLFPPVFAAEEIQYDWLNDIYAKIIRSRDMHSTLNQDEIFSRRTSVVARHVSRRHRRRRYRIIMFVRATKDFPLRD